jgi:hypothetical protein
LPEWITAHSGRPDDVAPARPLEREATACHSEEKRVTKAAL